MTLFAQVQVYRKLAEFSHVTGADKEPRPEIGWVVSEDKEGNGVIAGFAADGSPFHASGKLSDLLSKTKVDKPLEDIPVQEPSGSMPPA